MTIFYQQYHFRVRITFYVISTLLFIVCVRLIQLHVVKNEYYTKKVNTYILDNQRLEGERGFIFDRNGKYLARNIEAYTFVVDTHLKYDRDIILNLFPKIYGKSREYYEKKLQKKSNSVT